MERHKNDADADKNKLKEQSVTYDMYAELPDDGQRYEILNGVLELMSPGPSPTHQEVSRELEFIFMQGCRNEFLIYHAPIDVILSDRNVVQPDILMLHRSRQHIVTNRGIEGAPDLIVEIVSPGSRSRDRITKFNLYAQHGVPEYWIIDAVSRTLERYRLAEDGQYQIVNLFEGDEPVYSDKLPCVSFVLSEIFRDIRV